MIQPSRQREPNDFHSSSAQLSGEEVSALKVPFPRTTIKIDRARVQIEATLLTAPEGESLTSLVVTASTPQGLKVVNYKLTPRPAGPVALELAQLLLQEHTTGSEEHRQTGTSDNDRIFGINLLRELKEVADKGGHKFQRWDPTTRELTTIPRLALSETQECSLPVTGTNFASNVQHTSPPEDTNDEHVKQPMRRERPTFQQFLDDPHVLDKRFFAKEVVNGIPIEAKATIHPAQQVSIIKARAFPSEKSEEYQFKMGYPEAQRGQPRTEEEVLRYLSQLTWKVMEDIAYRGPAKALEAFGRSDVDDRLKKGNLRPSTCERRERLPSGATVSLEVGDSVATLLITSSNFMSPPTRLWWSIQSKNGVFEPDDARLNKVREAFDRLVIGSSYQRNQAIETLDRCGTFDSKTPSLTKPKKTPSLTKPKLAKVFRWKHSLKNTRIKMSEPLDPLQIIGLLDGFFQISFTYKTSAVVQKQPHLPYHMTIGISKEGAMKVDMTTPLCNHFQAIIPPSEIASLQGPLRALETLGRLFDQQTDGAIRQLRAFLEGRATTPPIPSRLRQQRLQLPASTDTPRITALEKASKVMQILIAEFDGVATQGKALFPSSNRCELVITHSFTYPGVRMHLMTSAAGIHSIQLVASEVRPKFSHSFEFSRPLDVATDIEYVRGILSLYNARCINEPPTDGMTPEELQRSTLFNYLKYLESVSSSSR